MQTAPTPVGRIRSGLDFCSSGALGRVLEGQVAVFRCLGGVLGLSWGRLGEFLRHGKV